jgi:hypothetical protein
MLNAFSHFSVYYLLESDLESLPETVTITATTEKGEKLTTQLPLQRSIDKQVYTISQRKR